MRSPASSGMSGRGARPAPFFELAGALRPAHRPHEKGARAGTGARM